MDAGKILLLLHTLTVWGSDVAFGRILLSGLGGERVMDRQTYGWVESFTISLLFVVFF